MSSRTAIPGIAVSVNISGKSINAFAGVRNTEDNQSHMHVDAVFNFNGVTRLMMVGIIQELVHSGHLSFDMPTDPA